jgi:chromosomal replication initiation ATPase DnaA
MGAGIQPRLGRHEEATQTKAMKISDIIKIVSAEMGVDQEEITSKSRVQEAADARAVVQAVMRDRGWIYSRIALVFSTDHATVMHNCRKIEQARAMVKAYDAVQAAIKNLPIE